MIHYSLRAVDDSDYPFLTELYISTRWQEMQQAPWTDQQRLQFLQQQFDAQTEHYRVHYPEASRQIIVVKHQPAGRLYLDNSDHEIRIVDIALLPQFCGQGIGGKILKTILETGDQAHKAVSIHVEKNNPALNLYQRLGFQQQKDVGVYWFMSRLPQG